MAERSTLRPSSTKETDLSQSLRLVITITKSNIRRALAAHRYSAATILPFQAPRCIQQQLLRSAAAAATVRRRRLGLHPDAAVGRLP